MKQPKSAVALDAPFNDDGIHLVSARGARMQCASASVTRKQERLSVQNPLREVAWRESAALTSQHGQVSSSPEPFVAKKVRTDGIDHDGSTIDVSMRRCPERGLSNGKRHKCSRLHDDAAKAPSVPSRFDPILQKTKLAQSDALITAHSSRCCTPVTKRSQKSQKKKKFPRRLHLAPPQTVAGKHALLLSTWG